MHIGNIDWNNHLNLTNKLVYLVGFLVCEVDVLK